MKFSSTQNDKRTKRLIQMKRAQYSLITESANVGTSHSNQAQKNFGSCIGKCPRMTTTAEEAEEAGESPKQSTDRDQRRRMLESIFYRLHWEGLLNSLSRVTRIEQIGNTQRTSNLTHKCIPFRKRGRCITSFSKYIGHTHKLCFRNLP